MRGAAVCLFDIFLILHGVLHFLGLESRLQPTVQAQTVAGARALGPSLGIGAVEVAGHVAEAPQSGGAAFARKLGSGPHVKRAAMSDEDEGGGFVFGA